MLAVVYLIFNEGYGGRTELAREAIRLGRVLAALMPDEPEAHGLLALMLLHDARRRARFAGEQELVLLGDQDRSLWDAGEIEAGRATLERALALRGRGPYVLQAAIASLHAEPHVDWPQVAALYAELATLTGSSVVELNRAVAVAMAFGPAAGLELVEKLAGEPALAGYHLLPSVRGELLAKLGRPEEARGEFMRAALLTRNAREQKLLLDRAAAAERP